MAVEVTYRGGGMDGVTSNAASEATLARLVALMEKKGGNGGAVSKMAGDVQSKGVKIQTEDNKATQESTESTKDQTKAQVKLTQKIANAGKALDRYTMGLFSGIGNTVNAIGGLGNELLSGGDRISDFGQHVTGLVSKFPIVGGVVGQFGQTMLNMMDSQIDTYRTLSNGGIDFGDSLFEMQSKAAQAGIKMETLAGVLGENSQLFAQAFGGATKGANEFSKITKIVQQSQQQFSALGMTMEDVTEFTADYIELQMVQGRMEGRSAKSLAKGTTAYVMQLDQLSKVTGMSRKQIADEMKSQSMDGRISALIMNMDDGMKAQINSSLTMIKGASPEMENALKELVATNGVPLSEFGKSLIRTNPQFAEMAIGLRNGTLTAEQFATQTNEQIKEAKKYVKENAAMISTSQVLGNTTYDAVLAMSRMATIGGKISDADQKQLDAVAAKEKILTNFDKVIQTVRSNIMDKLITSGIFDKMQTALSGLTAWFGKAETQTMIQGFIDRLGVAIDSIGTYIANFTKDFKTMKIGELVSKYIFEPIKRMFTGESKPPPGHPESNKGGASGEKGAGLFGTMFAALGPIIEKFETFGKALMWGGIGAAAVLIGFTVAVAAMATPLLIASPGIAALGLAFAGVGVAMYGISTVIDSIFSSIDKLAGGVKKFEDMDSKKLLDVGKSLGPLTSNIMGLAKGGIVASFVGDGALEKISAGVKSFEGIDSKSMKEMGPALTSLQKGISAFTGDGLMDSFSKFLGGLFGNDGGMTKMAKDLESFADIDAAGLKNIGDGLQGIAAYVEAMDDANLKSVSKNIKELIKQIKEYNEVYKTMDAETKASFTKVLNVNNESQDKSSSMLTSLNSVNNLILEELKKQTKGGKNMTRALSGAA